MKKFLSYLLCFLLILGSTACSSEVGTPRFEEKHKSHKKHDADVTIATEPPVYTDPVDTEPVYTEPVVETTIKEKEVIEIWAFNDLFVEICDEYLAAHPEINQDYIFSYTIIDNVGGGYQAALDNALISGYSTPDVFALDSSYLYKYTNDYMSSYVAPYSSIIPNFYDALRGANLTPYIISDGRRQFDDEIVALSYESTAGVFAYRRSIAQEVFGSDDPEYIGTIIGGASEDLSAFTDAASTLSSNGYKIVSSFDSLYIPMTQYSPAWVSEGQLNFDISRLNFMLYANELYEMGATTSNREWSAYWSNDMADLNPDERCFGYFAPSWLIYYTIQGHAQETFGDWAICPSPLSFSWGSTYACISNAVPNTTKAPIVANLLSWIMLDTSASGYQYYRLKTDFDGDKRFSIPSSITVLNSFSLPSDFLGGQDIVPVFSIACSMTYGRSNYMFDESFDYEYKDIVARTLTGELTFDEAINEFKEYVGTNFDVSVN